MGTVFCVMLVHYRYVSQKCAGISVVTAELDSASCLYLLVLITAVMDEFLVIYIFCIYWLMQCSAGPICEGRVLSTYKLEHLELDLP